jgi:hypothetical protein
VYLFNLTGYFLLQAYIKSSDNDLIKQLDEHQYDEAQLVEIKIPIRLPYATDEAEYQRIDGEIEFSGTYYNYVKRKISRDTLYVLCLPNKSKTRIVSAGNKLIKHVNDAPASEKNEEGSKKLIKSIELQTCIPVYTANVNYHRLKETWLQSEEKLPSFDRIIPVPPPEA